MHRQTPIAKQLMTQGTPVVRLGSAQLGLSGSHFRRTGLLATTMLIGLAGAVQAGGLDRSGQSITALFEQGRHLELSFGGLSPNVSGTAVAGLGGVGSGDLSPSFLQIGAAYKADINDQWSYAIIYDQPFGANVSYPTGTGYFAAGSTASFDAHAITGILRYKLPSNISFHAGLRVQSVAAEASVPFVSGYAVSGDRDIGIGYLVGAAYERPDIALRVSLTYNSAIDHEVRTTETSTALGGPNASVTEFETPQSLNLEFQTGIAENTLLFGGLRWAEWSEAGIRPADFATLTGGGSLVNFSDDVYTWSLGIGRKLNDQWSVAATLGYEQSNSGFRSNLAPTNGFRSIGVGATYTRDNLKITTGIRYVDFNTAQTQITGFAPAATFQDNDAIGLGVKVSYSF